jgi:CubicO group peptidase (beta-lactamase class C family)
LSLCIAPAAAQFSLPASKNPEEVRLSTSRLDKLEAVTRTHIESGKVPGAVILVARNGRVAWHRTLGYQDREAGKPMRVDSIFRIYSMTKPIVAVAVMMLAEEGRLRVEDPVSKYLPDLANMKVAVETTDANGNAMLELVPPKREMTILDLLRHTSGLIYGSRGKSLVNTAYQQARIGERGASNEELVKRVAKLPLRFSPGDRWEYGISTDVLGRVVEVISGKPLAEFLQERIFKPLRMVDTAFYVPTSKVDRAAQPWQVPGGAPMTPRFNVAEKPAFESGGGGLLSTMHDYLRFTSMLINRGELDGVRVLKPASVDFLSADHAGKLPGLRAGQGFGAAVEVQTLEDQPVKGASIGAYGWAGNAGTIFFIDPTKRLIGIYLVQVSSDDRIELRNEFRRMVYEAVVDTAPH